MTWLRRLLNRPDMKSYALALRQLAALDKARKVLPHDPVIEREWKRVSRVVKDTGGGQ